MDGEVSSKATSGRRGVIGLLSASAGGVETIRTDFVEPAIRRGWLVAVTLTPTAGTWLTHNGERDLIQQATGLLVRDLPRLPTEPRPHPDPDCFVIAPATANTVVKLALGIADNQGLTAAIEAIGSPAIPVIVFPQVNAAHVRHPAWDGHIGALRAAGVHLIYGDDIWPLHEPRDPTPGGRRPWIEILDLVDEVTATSAASDL